MGRLLDLAGEIADLPRRILHHQVALARLPIGLARRKRCPLGVLRHFLHGGCHLVNGGHHLFGFDALLLHTGTGLRGHRGKLLGGRGDLRNAAADTPDQRAQALRHVGHGLLQLTQLVPPRDRLRLGEIATCHALRQLHGIAQRHQDHPGDGRGGQQTEQHRQHRDHHKQHVGPAALLVHRRGGKGQGFVDNRDDHLRLLGHRLLEGNALAAVAAELGKGFLIVHQRTQGAVHGGFLVVVEPDLQAAADPGDILVDLVPALHGRFGTVTDEDVFQGTQVEHVLGQPRGRLGDGQRIAALEAVALQPEQAHGIVHIEFDELELLAAELRGLFHPGAHLDALPDQLAVSGKLLRIIGCGRADLLQMCLAFTGRSRSQLVQFAIELGHGLAQRSGRGLAAGQRIVALQATCRMDRRIDAGQLVHLAGTGDVRVDHIETGTGHRQGQQKHGGETQQQFLADGKIGEDSELHRGVLKKRAQSLIGSAEPK